ncbi:T9SS type A sorting domain-containing protein [Hymenobacter sp. M29]|uniref:T9SS type A sorting domain-containing protein n=1 Tax=Hymenobacter mellowenesis TaxID=3063995 RepID=A0ABT9AFL4_9BACT|nr:T9SS type A sorting domain-containing protein [Hymenobacter sp. M29]MDO7848653.1 T9SS type A sorting domain-containing protein [Hymenobacter sp. M29]
MKQLSAFMAGRLLSCGRRAGLLLLLAGPAAAQSFGPVSTYPTGASSRPGAMALNDVNLDGRPDVVVALSNNSVGVLLGLAGGLAPVRAYAAGSGGYPDGLAVGDVTGDAYPDIVTVGGGSTSLAYVFAGQASGFAGPRTYLINTTNFFARAVALGDINGDGLTDFVTVSQNTSNVGIFLALPGGGFAAVQQYPMSGTPHFGVVLGDLNNDGRLDIVATAQANSQNGGMVEVLLSQPSGGFASLNYVLGIRSNPISPIGVALGDVDGDGRPDIVTANYAAHTVGVLLGQGTGFGAMSSFSTGPGTGPGGVALGDVNGDGRLDIVTGNYYTSTVSVLCGQAGGGFAAVRSFAMPPGASATNMALGDMNGDGRPDIVVSLPNSDEMGVLLNTGTFTPLATARPTAAEVSVFPNPAHDAFAVTLPAGTAATQAELLNTLGQVVRRPTVAGPRFTVETAGLAPGVYSLRLRTGAAVVTKRVVID